MNQPDPYRIRPATAADEPAIQSVVFTVLREYGLRPEPGGTDADLFDIAARYDARGGAFLVLATADGRIVGCGGLRPVDAEEAEVRKMYFLPEARGRGYGRRLLEELIALARARGFRRLTLDTASVLHEAIALYRRMGFVPFQPANMPQRCDQAYVLHLAPPP